MIKIRKSIAAAAVMTTAALFAIGGAQSATCTPTDGGDLNVFFVQNGCTFPPAVEVDINLDNETAVNLVNGDANGVAVQFTSTTLIDAANGNATITPSAQGGTISDLTFSVPGFTFLDFLFKVQLTDIGTRGPPVSDSLTIEAFNGVMSLGSVIFTGLNANALLSFGVFADTTPFTSVMLSGTFDSVKQFDVSDLSPVPLPGAALLLLSGLAGLGWMGRRRKKA